MAQNAVAERSSSEEEVPSAIRGEDQGCGKETRCSEVAVTVHRANFFVEEAASVHAPSCCRDMPFLVALNTGSITIWLFSAFLLPIPGAVLWTVLGVLFVVHIAEGYFSETPAYLRQIIPSKDAGVLLRTLKRAAPRIVWHIGDHSRDLKLTSWEDMSAADLPLSDLSEGVVGVLFKVRSNFSVENEVQYQRQVEAFKRQVRLQDAKSPEVTTQLFVAGFSQFTHEKTNTLPVMRLLVANQRHALARPYCFWLAHLSVVFALPYRLWLSGHTRAATYTVDKNVTSC